MPSTNGKTILITLILGVTLTSAACNIFGGFGSAREDTPTPVDVEAQTVPQAIPTNTPKSAPTPKPTATKLQTEIIEPISPISPISPVATAGQRVVNQIIKSVQPIAGGEEALAAAVEDLSEQTGIPPDQITLVSMEAVDWSDASLGCPQEGFMYAQVITPGYKIVLETQGQQYEYHTDRGPNVVLCQE